MIEVVLLDPTTQGICVSCGEIQPLVRIKFEAWCFCLCNQCRLTLVSKLTHDLDNKEVVTDMLCELSEHPDVNKDDKGVAGTLLKMKRLDKKSMSQAQVLINRNAHLLGEAR